MSATVAGAETAVTPDPIFHALQGFQATAVLGTAIELGVFDEIAAGTASPRALAGAVNADEHGLSILLDALVASGFLATADGDGYLLSPVAQTFLVRDGQAYLGDLAQVFFSDWQWRGHLALPEAVRRGGVQTAEQDVEAPEHPFWETFAHAWTGASYPSAHALAAIVEPWAATRTPLDVLDVACGSGIYGATVAGARDDARVTYVDWPNVLESTRAYASDFGVGERAAYLPGDMFEVPLGGPYDLAVASHVFHHFARERCIALLSRIAAALKPEGRIAIHDFVVTETPAQEPAAALFSVIMLVRTARGRVYSRSDFEDMLDAAGFGAPELHEIPGLPTRVLVAGVT